MKLLMTLMALILLTMSFAAADTPLLVNGHVYQQGTSIGVPNVNVTVTCNSVSLWDMTDAQGVYVVEFFSGCGVGDTVNVCAGDNNCETGTVISIPRFTKNIAYVNLEIPEFGLIAASVALAGAVAGFVFLRKKK